MIKRSTLGEQILEAVLDMVTKKGYKKGDRLPTEKEIAALLGVSRNSVREAMKTLNLAGITESTAGKGTFLLVDPSELRRDGANLLEAVAGASLLELLQVRRMLETEAAFLAAQRAGEDAEGLTRLRNALERLNQALEQGRSDVSEEGFAFHDALVRLSGNRLMVRMHQSIVNDLRRSRELVTVDLERAGVEEDVHSRIYRAVAAGDGPAARQAAEAHFANTEACYRSYLGEDNGQWTIDNVQWTMKVSLRDD